MLIRCCARLSSCAQAKYNEAQPLVEEALRIRLRFLPKDHPDIITSRGLLADLYVNLGSLEKASILEHIVSDRERVHGPEHPFVASALNDWASLLEDQVDTEVMQILRGYSV